MVFEYTAHGEYRGTEIKSLIERVLIKLLNHLETHRQIGDKFSEQHLHHLFSDMILSQEVIEFCKKVLFRALEKADLGTNHLLENKDTSKSIFETLTSREKQCLDFCVKGLSAKGIARELNISYRTVEGYLANLKKKFDCKTLRELTYKFQTS